MENQTKQRTKKRIHPVIAILAGILAIECLCMGWRVASSRMKRTTLTSVAESEGVETGLRGKTLLLAEDTIAVDDALLSNLSEWKTQGIQMISLPLGIMEHSTGMDETFSIDSAWLGQLASAMEMVFQSGYEAILSPQLPSDSAWERYVAMWSAIDASFGHRPAGELRYQIVIPSSGELRDYLWDLEDILAVLRGSNAQRRIILQMPQGTTPEELGKLAERMVTEGVDYGIWATSELDESTIMAFVEAVDDQGNYITLLQPESEKDNEALTARMMEFSAQHSMDFILAE